MTVTVCDEEKPDPKTSLKAIRMKCLDCSAGSAYEVRLCPVKDCPLWSRRFGKNPIPKKMSEENRKKAIERLRKYREEKKRPGETVRLPVFALDLKQQ